MFPKKTHDLTLFNTLKVILIILTCCRSYIFAVLLQKENWCFVEISISPISIGIIVQQFQLISIICVYHHFYVNIWSSVKTPKVNKSIFHVEIKYKFAFKIFVSSLFSITNENAHNRINRILVSSLRFISVFLSARIWNVMLCLLIFTKQKSYPKKRWKQL